MADGARSFLGRGDICYRGGQHRDAADKQTCDRAEKIALLDRPYFGQSEKLNALAYERNNHDWFAAKAVTYASPKNAGEHCGPNRDRKRARRAKGARAVCRGEALKSRSRV